MLVLLGLAGAVPLLACVAAYLWRRAPAADGARVPRPLDPRSPTRPPAGRALRLARGLGWCTLCAAPAIVAQDVFLAAGLSASSGFGLGHLAAMLPFQVWVLPGGAAVQAVFEETAKDLSGHRQTTMIDNWPIYYGMTLAWLLPWSAVIASRLRQGPLRRDRVAWVVGTVVLANALAGIAWPWWGS